MKTIEQIEDYAHEQHIPIARRPVVDFMINLIKENNYKSFLEIGTAIGYTTSVLYSEFNDLKITTIEKNEIRGCIANTNFVDLGILDKINFIMGDATTFETDEMFDLIFIDASKKKNKFYLDKFTPNLSENGTIIIDNLNLDDLWVNCDPKKKKMFDNVNKELEEYIKSSDKYDSNFYFDIGDGIAVIKHKR